MSADTSLPRLPPRRPDSHKGDFGRALLIGGSRGMAGAIALAGMACLRSGAGLVKLAVPECILDTVAGFEPSYMTVPLACDGLAGDIIWTRAKRELEQAVEAATAIAVGPGLGKNTGASKLVDWLYEHVRRPVILDADALNVLAAQPDGLSHPGGGRILTPHPGEFSRLVASRSALKSSRDEQLKHAIRLALEHNIVILVKGHRTYITDGDRERFNTTGNPGLATGGTGDVLTGVITALVCQGLSPFDAAVLGAHVHGLAGDLAAAELGQVSLVASDLLGYLPRAFQAVA